MSAAGPETTPGAGGGAVITGWGCALPEKTVTNADLAATLNTSDEWITERTGIRERRIGGTTGGMAVAAGRQALDRAGVAGDDIDLVILATSTPDQTMPATASAVQHELGLTRSGAFDVNAACSGFVYALVAGYGLVGIGANRILVIGSEVMSRLIDWDDRNTAVLFGDGAGAVVLEAVEGPGSLLGWHLGSEGSSKHILYTEHGAYLQMDGKEVFRRAVRVVVESASISLANAGLTIDDVDVLVAHQANRRIIESACNRLRLPMDKAIVNLDRVGNTSAASIPLALAEAVDQGKLRDGHIVLTVGFGAGMSSASAVLRWGR